MKRGKACRIISASEIVRLQPSLCRERPGFLSSRSDQKDTIMTGNGASVHLGEIAMRTRSATVVVVKTAPRSTLESTMSEAQFDRLLDAVRTAIEPAPQALAQPNDPLQAANDNGLSSRFVPFPEGWYAAH